MVDIPIKAKVECSDGPCGVSVAVIVNPTTRTVTHFVVEQSFLDPDQRMVPVEKVTETTASLVRLGCTKDELAEMEPFIERRFVEGALDDPAYWYAATDTYMEPYVTPAVPPYEEVQRTPPGELAIYRGTPVDATDGHVGTVGELVVDPVSGHITHIVLQEGHLWGKKETTLPLSAIDRVEADAVYLKLDKQAVERLPATPLQRHYQEAKAKGKEIE